MIESPYVAGFVQSVNTSIASGAHLALNISNSVSTGSTSLGDDSGVGVAQLTTNEQAAVQIGPLDAVGHAQLNTVYVMWCVCVVGILSGRAVILFPSFGADPLMMCV